ncbi:hypothetical protein DSOUD_1656 [Desulfuromonas soudanensis]|uniref:Fibronectin type-III domain-containing protein n=1 Tax=Desulfuromonas soudanensis TaxID=1603606 RepID=A0A0M4D151_9BACT|nr:hypothetical protein [Desulfuromonas soudanensis]ALC16434.1 hypothetical protein DSOUD_1656 [Desulfuromonas soudanensis]
MKKTLNRTGGRPFQLCAHQLLLFLWTLVLLFLPMAGCNSSSSPPPATPELAVPQITSLTSGDGTATVAWTTVPGAIAYNLYGGLAPGVTPANGLLVADVVSPLTVTGLENGTSYYCVVTAVHPAGESFPSAEGSVTLAPSAPASISVTATDVPAGETYTPSVIVQWSDVPVGATSYNLYRSEAPPVTLASPAFPGVTSPYTDLAVSYDTTYYYMVTAVGVGGESLPSQQVSVQPRLPLDAPVNVTATVTEEATRSITLSWSPPLTGAAPESYNLYRSETPGVIVDPANRIAAAVTASPYVDTAGLVGGVTYYYVITAVIGTTESAPSAEVSATARGSRSTTGGGGDTGYGNNLSFPLVFADGYGVTGTLLSTTVVPPYTLTNIDVNTGLRPTVDELASLAEFPHFDPLTVFLLNSVPYYEQQTVNTWQADWVNGIAADPGAVQEVTVDWGDNLASVSFSANSVIRVETVLYQDTALSDPADTLTAYNMALLFGSQVTEMQGTDATTYESTRRNVFAVTARLTIEKLDGPGGNVVYTLFDRALAENFGIDGTGGYSAEINVAGRLVYGYNWMLNQDVLPEPITKTGWWRLTFSLDDSATIGSEVVNNHTSLVAMDPSDTTALLDTPNNFTSIEVEVR